MPTSVFFFSSRRRHTRCYRDWSSDVCSSDLALQVAEVRHALLPQAGEWAGGVRSQIGVDGLAGVEACPLAAQPCDGVVIVALKDIEVFERQVDLASACVAEPTLFELSTQRRHQRAIDNQSGESFVQLGEAIGARWC